MRNAATESTLPSASCGQTTLESQLHKCAAFANRTSNNNNNNNNNNNDNDNNNNDNDNNDNSKQ